MHQNDLRTAPKTTATLRRPPPDPARRAARSRVTALAFAAAVVAAGLAASVPSAEATLMPGEPVAAGSYHTCVVRDRNVHCWGESSFGQANAYLGGDATSVATGYAHTCALRSNGNVHCWGSNAAGQAQAYSSADAVAIAAGGWHTCALRSNGNAHCWGNNEHGQANAYAGGDATRIAAHRAHTCVLRVSGHVHCWGQNQHGQANAYLGGDATGIAVGSLHTCALRSNGNAHCWGWNGEGQANAYLGGDATGIAAGNAHTCVLRSNGSVHCWGDNGSGQAAAYLGGDATRVAAGWWHTCALRSNAHVRCWGANTYGQLGALPTEPRSLAASAGPGQGEITLTWIAPLSTGSSGILAYRLYRSASSQGPYTLLASPTGTSWTDAGLGDGVTRHYFVTAVNAVGEGPASPTVSATTFTTPDAPQSLSGTSGSGEIGLSWQPPASNGGLPVTGYEVHAADASGGPYALVGTPTGTSFLHQGLVDGVTKHYFVKAVNALGTGPASGIVSATTLPGAPQSLVATTASSGQISLSWQPPASNGGAALLGYEVHAADASAGPYSLVGAPGTTSFLHQGLGDGVTKHYRVKAVNAGGAGPASGTASATTLPGAPQSLVAATGGSAGQIDLSWQPPAANGGAPITGYEVHAAEQGAGPYTLVGAPSGTSFLHQGLGDGVTKHYRVKAVNAGGTGPASAPASATTLTLDSAPQRLQATGGPESIFLHWEPPHDQEARPVDSYRIYKGESSAAKSFYQNWESTAFVDEAAAGMTLYYQVSAVSTPGEGPRSNEAQAAAFGVGRGETGTRSLFTMSNFTLGGGVSLPPTDPVAIVTVRNHASAPQTCLDVTIPAANQTQNVACWSQLIPGDDQIPRGDTPIGGTAGDSLGQRRVTVTAAYRFDAARLWKVLDLGEGAMRVYAPASPADTAWWTSAEGAAMGLRLHVLVWNGGDLVEARELIVPHVGQALAAAEFTSGTQP